mmetsp:Transcript_18745/g.8737  ORF Transcript_18745/g.8737 Transcript_18745/m.8737 type:complete len:93 (+) Transcript_18745:391-669(+)|eukprot:CAMPEP_0201283132 /NCGR_PEP_ID=MMETSP1317-20130820/7704_1 /ASSEMBLY_ACC=CAM_ASM_000770 /TAXON_ID=187299 /ORGANISM="Undescribed Undescribed, Strain Undescribed" /LENGTH=92 /DNA_ID=CAMNT_0047598307 /DNA_START=428 /DNA_END=706 /DNA_ORIENTATION=+
MKPENIMLDGDFNIKICDFGFAKDTKYSGGKCETTLGTSAYMAPEIHEKKVYSGASVDLFAAGVILFIMMTQNPPFTNSDSNDKFYKLHKNQ